MTHFSLLLQGSKRPIANAGMSRNVFVSHPSRYYSRRFKSTATESFTRFNKAETFHSVVVDSSQAFTGEPPVTARQFRILFLRAAIPMIGFGIMDQTIMLQAGNAIDCTLGVTFGLSTLTAAAFGQVCSDASGVLFGGTLESLACRAGLPKTGLTLYQRSLPVVKRVRLLGSFCGVLFGCCLGLVNLFFIDTRRSTTLKLEALTEVDSEFDFEIEVSNQHNIPRLKDTTMLKISGPNFDGLLASMTAALSIRGCSLVELKAGRRHKKELNGIDDTPDDEYDNNYIEDIFFVVKRETGKPYEDDELIELGKSLLDATRTPMNILSVRSTMHELENTNSHLKTRVAKLEQLVYEKQIKVVPKHNDDNLH
jgi:Transmembrane protein 65